MKRYILYFITGLLTLPAFSQSKEAKDLLDKTSEAIRKSGDIRIGFDIKVLDKLQPAGNYKGDIKLKAEKFVLETEDAITWFDGETQWTYMKGSDEVNISNPTQEEIQSINPYALLSIYKNGYNYRMGKTKSFQGKAVSEVILESTDKERDLSKLNLYITPLINRLVYLEAELKDGTRNEITITAYEGGVSYSDNEFSFDKTKYPDTEIIDLR